jgi:hypothetical protein
MKDALIRIVFDSGKKKYRAQAPDGAFIRFPNHLRQPNTQYLVDLTPGKGGSWIVDVNKIRPVLSAIS